MPNHAARRAEATALLRASVATLRRWRHVGDGSQLPPRPPLPLPPR